MAGGIALSLIMPCYRKAAELAAVLPHNARWLTRADIEIVLVLDDPSDEAEVLAVVDALPHLRVRVIVNDLPHAWRPPGVAINVGLRAATGAYVLVCSPESAFVGDVPAAAITALGRFPGEAIAGQIAWASFAEARDEAVETLFQRAKRRSRRQAAAEQFYGSIAAPRALFHAVRGYDEAISGWGGDDDNIRLRMMLTGAKLVLDPDLRLLHLDDPERAQVNRAAPRNDAATLEHLLNPMRAEANPERWGVSFGRRAREWIMADVSLGTPPIAGTPPGTAFTDR